MSGAKNTTVTVGDSAAAELVGGILLLGLLVPVVAGKIAFFAGKTIIKGGMAAGEKVSEGIEKYQEYQEQQAKIRKREMELRLKRETEDALEEARQILEILEKWQGNHKTCSEENKRNISQIREYCHVFEERRFEKTLPARRELKRIRSRCAAQQKEYENAETSLNKLIRDLRELERLLLSEKTETFRTILNSVQAAINKCGNCSYEELPALETEGAQLKAEGVRQLGLLRSERRIQSIQEQISSLDEARCNQFASAAYRLVKSQLAEALQHQRNERSDLAELALVPLEEQLNALRVQVSELHRTFEQKSTEADSALQIFSGVLNELDLMGYLPVLEPVVGKNRERLKTYQLRKASAANLPALDGLLAALSRDTVELRALACYSDQLNRLEALWNELNTTQECSQKFDSNGYFALSRLYQSIRGKVDSRIRGDVESQLTAFQEQLTAHKHRISVQLASWEAAELEKARVREANEPILNTLQDQLTLADTEPVRRWAKDQQEALQTVLKNLMRKNDAGALTAIESEVERWNEDFEQMLLCAGLAQKDEDRRLYILQSMKSVLPELGFDIQSMDAQPEAPMNDVVIKARLVSQPRRKITITVPHQHGEKIHYRFEGFDTRTKRVAGTLLEENDDGKNALLDITRKLRPFGICLGEPDWKGNPDKIMKGAKDLPRDVGQPAEYVNIQETKYLQEDL